MGLRAYQMKARQDIHKGFEEFDRQLGVLPTGAGKTILFSRLAQDYQPQRTLILAHREEWIGLVAQATSILRTKFESELPPVLSGLDATGIQRECRRAIDEVLRCLHES